MPLTEDEDDFPSSSDAETTSTAPPPLSDSPGDWSEAQPVPGVSEESSPEAEVFDPRSREDFRGLLYLGALTAEYEVYGHQFEMRTLNTDEVLQIGLLLKDYDGTVAQGKAYATAIVASAMVSVDGKPLPAPFQDEPGDSPLRHRVRVVGKWYPQVIDVLYSHYLALEQRVNTVFDALGKASG